jgi:hypothetical protein
MSNIFKPSVDNGGYYYSRLSDEQKSIYRIILSGIETYAEEIKLPMKPINEISMIFNRILLDNPTLFYTSSFSQINDLCKQKCIVKPDYKYSNKFVRQNTNHIKTCLQTFEALKTKRDIEKEMYVHDYCLNNFKYDYTFADYSYLVLGPVLNNTAVCEGIAKFVKLAFDYLGIESVVVSGKAKNPINSATEGHAWNVVKIDGKTYHLDVTFDMTLKDKTNRYDYFNLTDEDIKKDHTALDDLPVCSTIGNDYFSVNSLVVFTPAELEKIIGNGLTQGKKNITVKLKNVKNTESVVDKVMSVSQQQYMKIYKRGVTVEVKYNLNQAVFDINFK